MHYPQAGNDGYLCSNPVVQPVSGSLKFPEKSDDIMVKVEKNASSPP
jgi:hypothetical protein